MSCTTLFRIPVVTLLFAGVVPGLYAQGLNLYLSPATDVAAPGDRVVYAMTVTNTGVSNLTGVSVRVPIPASLSGAASLGEPFGCTGGGLCTWTVGTMAPGQSRSLVFFSTVRATATGAVSMTGVASATGASDASSVATVAVDPVPLLRLSLAPDPGPAAPGEPFTYTLTYGNAGTSTPSNVVLQMPLPDGTTFASASEGGTARGGVVTWALGLVGAGSGGQVHLTVVPDGGLSDGQVIRARAEIDPGAAPSVVVGASAVTAIRRHAPLSARYAVSQTTGAPGDRITYTVTLANTGAVNLTDVSASLAIPPFLSGAASLGESFGCTGGGLCTWTVGTMAPGQSRSLVFNSAVRGDAPQGELVRLHVVARSSGQEQAVAAQDLHVDPVPLLRLSLAPDPGPAAPGEPFTYTLTYGNAGTSTPSNVVLQVPLPRGTRFTTASEGGVEHDGVVTWNLGTLGVGAGGQVRLTVTPDAGLPDGSVLEAVARLDPGVTSASVVRSSATTAVRRLAPLRVHYAVSQTTAAPGDRITYTATVTNTGPVNLTGVAANLFVPSFVSGAGDLGESFGCTGGGLCTWTVGTVAPGESRTLVFASSARGDAPQGELIRARVVARSSGEEQTSAALDVHVDPAPLLRLGLAPDPGPAAPGEPFTYRLTFGNAGPSSPTDVLLRMPVPAGVTFVSASCGGTLEDGVVEWDLGTLPSGTGGQFFLTVTPGEDLPDGSVLEARAEIDPGVATAAVVRASAVTPVARRVPLRVTFAADRLAAAPRDQVTYELTAVNTGAVNLTDVSVALFVPTFVASFGGSPGFGCTGGGLCTWTVGTMAPGQSRTIALTGTLATAAPAGHLARTQASARATGSGQRTLQVDVLSGSLKNFPPQLARMVTPADGASLVIGGGVGEPPVPPDSAFVAGWEAPCDPEDDPLTYTWQLSTSPDFSSVLLEGPGAEGGTAARFETDLGTLALALSAAGALPGGAVTLYHRALAHDGVNTTAGEPARLVLTRGTLVHVAEPGLPEAFALHDNYPNPFNPTTTFVFDLPRAAHAELAVFDVAGRRVAVVVSGALAAGTHRYTWDAGALPSGVYLYRLRAGTYTSTRKLTLLR